MIIVTLLSFYLRSNGSSFSLGLKNIAIYCKRQRLPSTLTAKTERNPAPNVAVRSDALTPSAVHFQPSWSAWTRPALRVSGSGGGFTSTTLRPRIQETNSSRQSSSRFGSSHRRRCPDCGPTDPFTTTTQKAQINSVLRIISQNSAKNLTYCSNNLLVCFYLFSNTWVKGQQAHVSDAV